MARCEIVFGILNGTELQDSYLEENIQFQYIFSFEEQKMQLNIPTLHFKLEY